MPRARARGKPRPTTRRRAAHRVRALTPMHLLSILRVGRRPVTTIPFGSVGGGFMPSRNFMAAIALALVILPSPAPGAKRPKPAPAPPAAAAALTPATLRVERFTLANGLTVLAHEDHTVPTITLWQWYRVGSRNERPGITGISHFFEHMMFNGAKKYGPKMYDRTLESSGGLSNAFTDRDMTAYYEDIASDRYDVLFDLDSDRMASLALQPEMI